MVEAILEDETDVEYTVERECVLVITVAAVAHEDFVEKDVADSAPRLCVRACDRKSAVGSTGSFSMELSGSEGLVSLPGGPVDPLVLQTSRPTVRRNPSSKAPKLVEGLPQVGRSVSTSMGFPS